MKDNLDLFDGYDVVMQVFEALKAQNATFSSAESCTGGDIAHRITLIPGSSDVFAGSVVSYATYVKIDVLGVPAEIINNSGVVSRKTAEAMAEGALRLLSTDYAVSTTGVAGPSGGSAQNPVGTVCIAVAAKRKTVSREFHFGSDRTENIRLATVEAYKMLLDLINCDL